MKKLLLILLLSSCTIVIKIPCGVRHDFKVERKDILAPEKPNSTPSGAGHIGINGLLTQQCTCGCGMEAVTPLGNGEWSLIESNNQVTLRPSIGNFKGENPYHAHYYITNNKIDWL